MLWSVRSHHRIATTWSDVNHACLSRVESFLATSALTSSAKTWTTSPSRKRRSVPQWHHRRVQEEEVRRCFAMVFWRLDINSGKRRRSEEKISKLRESKLSQSILVASINLRTFRRQCCWSYIARQCTVTERIYRVHLPHREREWIEFYIKKCINSRRNKPQERKTSGLLHCSGPDRRRTWRGRNSIESCETKDRSVQEYLETPSKHCVLVQFEARSRERLAIWPNTVTCSRSLQHTACSLHWESRMYENPGGALPEGAPNSESVTSRAKIELAIWSTRSTKPRSKIILGTIERFEMLRGNL